MPLLGRCRWRTLELPRRAMRILARPDMGGGGGGGRGGAEDEDDGPHRRDSTTDYMCSVGGVCDDRDAEWLAKNGSTRTAFSYNHARITLGTFTFWISCAPQRAGSRVRDRAERQHVYEERLHGPALAAGNLPSGGEF